jgi:hypothetical protein
MAVVAPMHSAIVAIATNANPGDLRSMRAAYFKSKSRFSIRADYARRDGLRVSLRPRRA